MQHAGYRASVYIVKVSVLMYIELISLYIYDIFFLLYFDRLYLLISRPSQSQVPSSVELILVIKKCNFVILIFFP